MAAAQVNGDKPAETFLLEIRIKRDMKYTLTFPQLFGVYSTAGVHQAAGVPPVLVGLSRQAERPASRGRIKAAPHQSVFQPTGCL